MANDTSRRSDDSAPIEDGRPAERDEHFATVAETWLIGYVQRSSFAARLATIAPGIAGACMATNAVLDVGGGPGVFSVIAASEATFVVCLDPSLPMLDAGRRQEATLRTIAEEAGYAFRPERVSRVAGDVACLAASADARFDVVLAIAVLEYVEDPARLVERLLSLTKAGGKIFMSVPDSRSVIRRFERPLDAMSYRLGLLLRRERWTRRRYSALRPSGSRVEWASVHQKQTSVCVCDLPIPLGAGVFARRIQPNRLIILQKRDASG